MRKINEMSKRALTFLLAFVMVITLVPLNLLVVAEDSVIGSTVRIVSDTLFMYREPGEYAVSQSKEDFPETMVILDVSTVAYGSLSKIYYKLGTVDESQHAILNTYCWTEDYNVEIISNPSWLTIDDMQVGVLYKAKFQFDVIMPLARIPFLSTYDDFEAGLLEDYAVELAILPATVTVTRLSESDWGYVYVTDETEWPSEYLSYRYVDAGVLCIVDGNGMEISPDDMQIGTVYSATWSLYDGSNSIAPSRRVAESEITYYTPYDDVVTLTDEFPTELIVERRYEGDETVYVTNTNWPSWLEQYRYFDVYVPEDEWGDIVVTGVYTPPKPDEDDVVYGQVDLIIDSDHGSELVIAPGEREYVYTNLGDAIGEEATYRWQLLVDKENNLWGDIWDYYYPYAVITEALILNARDQDGKATLRCIVTEGNTKYISNEIKVSLEQPMALLSRAKAGDMPLAYAEGEPETQESETRDAITAFHITIKYEFLHENAADPSLSGSTAIKTFTITLPPGAAFNEPIVNPSYPGYEPYLEWKEGDPTDGIRTYGGKTLIPADEVPFDNQKEGIVVTVYYLPKNVSYRVIHYKQNLQDDEYTEWKTEFKTGLADTTVADDLALDETGFSSLYYEKNTRITNDGGTVVEIYYDRIYYLVKYDIGDDAYGVTPSYVRYGTTLMIGKPTNPGYTFDGWKLTSVKDSTEEGAAELLTAANLTTTYQKYNVTQANSPITVAHNLVYTAQWSETDVSFAIIYWKENANDNGYSCWGVQTVTGHRPGEEVTVDGTNIPQSIHKGEKNYFTYNSVLSDTKVTVKGDGSAVANVYYYRNIYTLTFQANGLCNIPAGHTHTDACYDYICGSSNHVHDENCILTCTTDPHTHDYATCGCSVKEHTHSSDCCSIPPHAHGAGCCDLTPHTHSLSCYTNQTLTKVSELNGDNRRDPDYNTVQAYNALVGTYAGRNPSSGFVYRINGKYGQSTSRQTYNFFYYNGTWYYLGIGNEVKGISHSANTPSNNSNTNGRATMSCGVATEHTHGINCNCDQVVHDHTSGCNIESCTNGGVEHTHGDGKCNYICGKTAHVHGASCYDCGEDPHEHTDACKRLICGIPLNHTCNNDCKNEGRSSTVAIITGKYGSDIREKFPIKGLNDASFAGYWWLVPNQSIFLAGGKYIVSLDQIPGEDLTFKGTSKGTNAVIYYYVEALPGSPYVDDLPNGGNRHYELYKEVITAREGYFTEKEEFHAIEGFTSGYKAGLYYPNTIFSREVAAENYLYYTRNSHTLQFHSNNVHLTDLDQTVLYGASMSGYAAILPTYPTTFEKNAYQFAGWYTTAGCYDGTEYDFTTETMPDQDVLLYAKWVSTSWDVEVYLDEAQTIPMYSGTVPFGSMEISEPNYKQAQLDHPAYKDLIWAGWYYKDAEGNEIRFDFQTMAIKTHYNGTTNPITNEKYPSAIYAKWTSEIPVGYVVRYVTQDANGNYVDIADPTTGVALAGINKSFIAKAGEELYAAYRQYLPKKRSYTHKMNTIADENVIYFEYVTTHEVEYTIKHVFKDDGFRDTSVGDSTYVLSWSYTIQCTDQDFLGKITVDFDADLYEHVTDSAIWNVIKDLSPDAYKQELILTSHETNEIVFNWEDRGEIIIYQVIHYFQKLDYENLPAGEQYAAEYYQEFVGAYAGNPSVTIAATPIERQGFELKAGQQLSMTLYKDDDVFTERVLSVYYDRKTLEYKVQHIYGATIETETKEALYEEVVTEEAKTNIPGYVIADPSNNTQSVSVMFEGQIINFYYVAQTVIFNYQTVGGGGFLSSAQETVSIGTAAKGSAPIVSGGYIFVGWYTDEAATNKVDDAWVDANGKLTPVANIADANKTITLYAKFVPYSLTIKNVYSAAVNPHPALDAFSQGFVYIIQGVDGTATAGIKIRIAVMAGQSQTILGLPAGEYTVTVESAWSWRYTSVTDVLVHSADGSLSQGEEAGSMSWNLNFMGSDEMQITYAVPGPDVSGTTENNSYYFITDNATN